MIYACLKRWYRNVLAHEVIFIPFAGALAFQALFIMVPLILLFIVGFTVWPMTEGTFISASTLFRILGRSFFLATSTTLISGLLAYPVSLFIAQRNAFLKTFFIFLLLLPFWTNFLLHILAWFFVLERTGFLNNLLLFFNVIQEPAQFLNSTGAVFIMMIYYYLPFMILPLYAVMERFDYRLVEASLDLGATWWQTFWRIIIPLTWPGFMTGFFLVFIPSFGEFAIPELMGGDKYLYVGSAISYAMLNPDTQPMGIIVALISCLFLASCCIILWYLFKRIRGVS